MKRKILFLISSLGKGGAEKVLVNLLNKISHEKYEIDLCVVIRHGVYLKSLPINIEPIFLFNNILIARAINTLHVKFNLSFFYKYLIRRKIKKEYDIAISFSDSSYSNLILMLKHSPHKKITWIHSSKASYSNYSKYYNDNYVRRIIKERYSKFNSIIFVSNDSLDEFKTIFGTFNDMRVIYNVLDINNIKNLSTKFSPNLTGDVNLIAVGSLLPVKGYDKLIAACKILSNEGIKFKLMILGDGPLKQELQNQINDLSLNEIIELKGFQENPYPYITNSDIFVMTSISEALPTSLCEAMILGKPVIVTNCSGSKEVIANGEYGILVQQSTQNISDGIRLLIKDKLIRDKYTLLSLERASLFNDENVLAQIYDLFDS